MNSSRVIPAGLLLILATALIAWGTRPGDDKKGDDKKKEAKGAGPCQPSGRLAALSDLPEASGLALSRRTPGVLWSHNDSGAAVVYALDAAGAAKGRVKVTGATVVDWEDVEVAPCPSGSCLYVADIGDNPGNRKQITVYRVPEPLPTDSATAAAEAFHATYPDGAQDAEALLVTGKGELWVATKGVKGPAALYRFPGSFQAGATVRLERVAGLGLGDKQRITDGAVSPDGPWSALRTHDEVLFYRTSELGSGKLTEALRADVSGLKEPQGEGLAIATDGTVYLASEGGGKGGTFARVTCTLPR
jgi:hypothetical protein